MQAMSERWALMARVVAFGQRVAARGRLTSSWCCPRSWGRREGAGVRSAVLEVVVLVMSEAVCIDCGAVSGRSVLTGRCKLSSSVYWCRSTGDCGGRGGSGRRGGRAVGRSDALVRACDALLKPTLALVSPSYGGYGN